MRPTEITWAGGVHDFMLPIEMMRAIQDKCDAGPAWVLARLSTNQWMVSDIVEPIRLGLEGGGMKKDEARKLVRQFVEDRPLTESLKTAQTVLMAGLYSVEDDAPGEPEAAAT